MRIPPTLRPARGSDRWPWRDESGFLTIQWIAMVALSMVFLAMLAQVIVFQYARGVARGALDEGVRVGAARYAGQGDCQAAVDRALSDLLGGAMGRGIVATCRTDPAGGLMRAEATGALEAWLPGMPDLSFAVRASAVKEPAP